MNQAATWVIGDVQGCYRSLQQLLSHPTIQADHHAHFCFAGDLINRGPDSLACLRLAYELGARATVVLGNHDIHFLGRAAGTRKPNRLDTLDPILEADDGPTLIEWLRHRPLLVEREGYVIVHAGIEPSWSLADSLHYAHEVEQILQAEDWHQHIASLFGNEPDYWDPNLTGIPRLRAILNVLTRMRTRYRDGRLNFEYKYAPTDQDGELAWFDFPRVLSEPVVFGHWSTLGLYQSPNAICLDTGCLWGGTLTAMRLHDRTVVQVPSLDGREPTLTHR